jgi:flagellar biosynthesis protein FliQ
MRTLYASLLRLYPVPYRQQFAEEMISVFREADADAHKRGSIITARLYFREIIGLFRGAIAEHARRILGNDVSFPVPLRRFTMRSDFRFPKTTAFLMTVILAGVVLAIEEADAIRASVSDVNPPVVRIQPAHLTFLPKIVLTFLVVYIVGALGWAILFALRRSGVHRLSEMQSAPDRGES